MPGNKPALVDQMPPKLSNLPFCTLSVVVALAYGVPPCQAADAAGALVANTRPTGQLNSLIFGHAEFNASAWQHHLQAGVERIDCRDYQHAIAHLSAALEDLRKHNINDERALQTRLALAQAYLGSESLPSAERLFAQAADRARELRQPHSRRLAMAGLAETLRLQGEARRAAEICKQLLSDTESAGENAVERGEIFATLAGATAAEGLSKPAIEAYRQSLSLLEKGYAPAYKVARVQYQLALELHNSGETEEANALFDKAFSTIDREHRFDVPLSGAPQVVIHWDEGSPRSRLIADPEYPLKYVLAGDLRVAATAVRSENVIAVLISLANCGRTRLPVAVGPVTFTQLKPKIKPFLYVPPEVLDVALEEEHVTELTWRRRWLNHIEKNRYIPGFLKNRALEPDNFFSNNTFGLYGNWGTLACTETPIVTREEFYYGAGGTHHASDNDMANFLSRSARAVNFHPTYVDPGEAKTGLVFFKQERFDKARLNIIVGNTIFEIPIDTAGPR
jgi:tetratricopeptide (TPR) repeat protein